MESINTTENQILKELKKLQELSILLTSANNMSVELKNKFESLQNESAHFRDHVSKTLTQNNLDYKNIESLVKSKEKSISTLLAKNISLDAKVEEFEKLFARLENRITKQKYSLKILLSICLAGLVVILFFLFRGSSMIPNG